MARNGVDTSSSAREICWGEHVEVFSTPKVVVVFSNQTGWTVSSSSAFDIMIQIPPLGCGFPLFDVFW